MPELTPLAAMHGQSPGARIAIILLAMAGLALIEALIPLQGRGRWHTTHLRPNLALTALTFATNLVFTSAIVLALAWAARHGVGLLNRFALPAGAQLLTAVLVLDLSFYVAHVAMHEVAWLWRFHRVHHSDPAVDVTTTIRQHPGETVIRYVAIAAFALPLGASPGAFAIYQLLAALSGLLEHANIRLPARLNERLALVFTWADMHKVHHARAAAFTNTNYGNLVSFWDRLFGTFTPARHGRAVVYGLDGLDDAVTQTTSGLLRLPFRDVAAAPRAGRCQATVPARAGAGSARRAG